MAVKVYSVLTRDDPPRVVVHCHGRERAYNEAFRLLGDLERFWVVEGWLVDEWVDLDDAEGGEA